MEKLSAKEAALLAAARRELQTGKGATPAPGTPAAGLPPDAKPLPDTQEKPQPSPAERIAQLIASEQADSERRKKRMRRYGIIFPATILVVAILWVVRALLYHR